MILDNDLVVSDAQAVTADVGSTNVLDLKVTGRKLGAGEAFDLVIFVDVAADAANADETYEFEIQTDDDVAFGSATELQAVAIPRASLTLNSTHVLPLSPAWTFERYLRVRYDVGGTTPSITATVALVPRDCLKKVTIYPNAYTVTH